jgi:Skp family chaperone for outer membrane proteins
MSILKVVNALKASIVIKKQHAICTNALDTRMLHAVESRFPGFNAAIESINTDIVDLQSNVDSLNEIESSINKANKKRKRVLTNSTNSMDSTTGSDLAKIQQELDKVRNENVLLKMKLQQSQQQLQQAQRTETESQQVLSELQQVNDELRAKCYELEPSRSIMDMDNTFTSMTIRLLAMGKCMNTELHWENLEIITLIRALQIPLIDTHFIQHHCLPCKFLRCCLSHNHSYLILTFLFFRSFHRCNQKHEIEYKKRRT